MTTNTEGLAHMLAEPRRLHPLTLLIGITRLGPRMFNIVPAILALGVTGNARYIAPSILAFLVITLFFTWLAWARFRWQVGNDDIAITSGVFSRNDRTIPFDRIQDVAIEQGVIHRVLGIATVSFDTGSAAAAKSDDGKLNAVALADAHELRNIIRLRRGAQAPTIDSDQISPDQNQSAQLDTGDGRLLFTMPPRRLFVAGLFNFSLAVIGILFGLLQTFDDLLPFNPFDFNVWRELGRGTALESWVNLHSWVAALMVALSLIVLGMASGVVRTVVREWGFRLERGERGFRRTRGLTTRTDVTLPLARVQAAIVVTGVFRRAFGWHELKLQNLANDGKNESDHSVAPFAKLSEVDGILSEVSLDRRSFEEGTVDDADWHRSHPIVIAAIPVILLIVTVASFSATSIFAADYRWVSVLSGASIPFMAVSGWFSWRHSRWHFDGSTVHIATGFLQRKHIILPARNVQSADITQGPLLRRFGVADIEFGVPGGKNGQHRIRAIPLTAAQALRGQIFVVP